MSKPGSVAPKERVNIVYKPSVGSQKEDVELPLKLLVLGDFKQRDDDTAVEKREPININKDNFDNVLAAHKLTLGMNVKNHISSEDSEDSMSIKLAIHSMQDFEPDQIIRQVPELEKLYQIRDALKALKAPLSNIPDFRKKIQKLADDQPNLTHLLKSLEDRG